MSRQGKLWPGDYLVTASPGDHLAASPDFSVTVDTQGRAGSGWLWPGAWNGPVRAGYPGGASFGRAETGIRFGRGEIGIRLGVAGCCLARAGVFRARLAGGAGEGEVVVLDDGCLGGGGLALGGVGELAGDGDLVVHDLVPAGGVHGGRMSKPVAG